MVFAPLVFTLLTGMFIAAEQEASKRGITINIQEVKTTKASITPIDKPSCSKTSCEDCAPGRIQAVD